MTFTRFTGSIIMLGLLTGNVFAMSVEYSEVGDFAFSEAQRRTIQTIAEATENEVRKILPRLAQDLTLEVRNGKDVIESTGESAAVAGPQKILWIVDPNRTDDVAAIAAAHLRFALFHEMHHLVRSLSMEAQSAPTLIDRAITEGLATAFARDFAGMPVSWWGEYPENIDEWAREFLALPAPAPADQWAAVGQWMFRHPDGRRFIGYKVGTYVVDKAMKESGLSSAELVGASSEEIVKLAASAKGFSERTVR